MDIKLEYFVRKLGIEYLPNKYFRYINNIYRYASLKCIDDMINTTDSNKIIMLYLISPPKITKQFLCDMDYIIKYCNIIDDKIKEQMKEYLDKEINKLS